MDARAYEPKVNCKLHLTNVKENITEMKSKTTATRFASNKGKNQKENKNYNFNYFFHRNLFF